MRMLGRLPGPAARAWRSAMTDCPRGGLFQAVSPRLSSLISPTCSFQQRLSTLHISLDL